jgi:hypothetical protein
VQRRGQPGFPDHVRRAAGTLVVQELGGGERAGPDRVLGDVDARGKQPCAQVAGREDRVVGEDKELLAGRLERGDELTGSGNRALFVHQHAVHVGQPALHRFVLGHRLIVIA